MSALRLCLVSPFALDGAHPVAEHVRGVATALRRLGPPGDRARAEPLDTRASQRPAAAAGPGERRHRGPARARGRAAPGGDDAGGAASPARPPPRRRPPGRRERQRRPRGGRGRLRRRPRPRAAAAGAGDGRDPPLAGPGRRDVPRGRPARHRLPGPRPHARPLPGPDRRAACDLAAGRPPQRPSSTPASTRSSRTASRSSSGRGRRPAPGSLRSGRARAGRRCARS